MVDTDLLTVVNGIIKEELSIVRKEFTPLTEGADLISKSGVDSLEYMVLYMWLGELYGIDNKVFSSIETLGDVSIAQLSSFITAKRTKTPEAQEALELYRTS